MEPTELSPPNPSICFLCTFKVCFSAKLSMLQSSFPDGLRDLSRQEQDVHCYNLKIEQLAPTFQYAYNGVYGTSEYKDYASSCIMESPIHQDTLQENRGNGFIIQLSSLQEHFSIEHPGQREYPGRPSCRAVRCTMLHMQATPREM